MELVYDGEKPKDFFVYLHRKLTTGEIFYIGKGSGYRHKTKNSRSKFWFKVARKHGVVVEIVQDGLQEWYAYELEQDLVDYYGRRDKNNGQLVNLSDGGGTKRNYKHTDDFKIKMKVICSENHRDKKIYSFVNCITEEEFTGTRQDFRNRYDIEPNSLFRKGNFKVVKNWKLKDSIVTDSMSLSNTIVRTRIYKFIHRSGEQFIGTRLEFSNKFKLNMNRLFMKNSRKSLYGWKVEEA